MKNSASIILLLVLLVAAFGNHRQATPEQVTFATEDGATIYADLYGTGARGVVLAHGGRFDKASWEPQARAFAQAGMRVLAFDFRGYGQSRGGAENERRLDVLAAVRYLRQTGAQTVAVVGASMGGDYAAEAAELAPREIDRIVLVASGAYKPLQQMRGRKLFILCRDDVQGENNPRFPKIHAQFEKAAEPKELVLLACSAHAQFIFMTKQGDRLMHEIERFLAAR